MSLKDKFALWETKAKKDTPKGPTMRPGSRVSKFTFKNLSFKAFSIKSEIMFLIPCIS